MTSINAKVAAATIGSVLAGAAFAIAEEAGAHPSAALISSITALVTFIVAWLVPADILSKMAPEPEPESDAGVEQS